MTYATQPAEQDSSPYSADSTDPEATAAVPPPPSALPGARHTPEHRAPVDGDRLDDTGRADADRGDTDPVAEDGQSAGEVYLSQAASDRPNSRTSGTRPEPVGAASPGLWGDGAADRYRDRFREIQIRFVDEPSGATGDARDLVSELFQELWDTLSARKAEIDRWENGDGENTEQLRTAVRGYRDLIDDLLAR